MARSDYLSWLGKQAVLSVESALDIIERAISEGLADCTGLDSTNVFGRPAVQALDPPNPIAHAMGLVTSGLRAHAVLDADDLPRHADLLSECARRHLPLVIHVRVRENTHRHFLSSSDTGWIQLIASDTQETVNLTLAAHRIAEMALLPVMIAIDAESTTGAVQFPDRDFITRYLGPADEFIAAPTPAQSVVFGKLRRRIPNWFHLDHATMHGISKSGSPEFLEAATAREFFMSHRNDIVTSALAELPAIQGAKTDPLRIYRADDADFVVLSVGSTFNRVAAVVEHLRKHRFKAGALGLTVWRPFPGIALCELLSGKKAVTVLEGVHADADADPPLFRSIEAILDKAAQNSTAGKNPPFPELPSISVRHRPAMYSGQFGLTPDYEDIQRVFQNMESSGARRFYCGADWARKSSSFPKQQVLLQQIARDYPHTAPLALSAQIKEPIAAPDSFAIRVLTSAGEELDGWSETVSTILSKEWNLRTHTSAAARDGRAVPQWQIRFTRRPYPYPLDGSHEVDALICVGATLRAPHLLDELKDGSKVILITPTDEMPVVSDSLLNMLRDRSLRLITIPKASHALDQLTGIALRLSAEFLGETTESGTLLARVEKICKSLPWKWNNSVRQDIEDGWLALKDPVDPASISALRAGDGELPLSVRRYEDQGPPYSRVAAFYDRCGYFYHHNKMEEILPDPFQSLPLLPAATLNFSDAGTVRGQWPVLVPEKCTACGRCAVFCPEAALAPIVLSVESLLKSASERVPVFGKPMTELTPPVIKNLSRLVNGQIAQGPPAVALKTILSEAATKVAMPMKIEGDRLTRLIAEVAAVADAFSPMDLVKSEAFFKDKDQGHLFAMAINPQACTGCRVCAEVCPEQALAMSAATTELEQRHEAAFRLWEQLPDTPAVIVEEKYEDEQYEPFAALLLSRNFNMATCGGAAGGGSSEKMMLHLVIAVAESVLQSSVNEHLKALDKRIADLSEKIQAKLREALPTGNLDVLAQSLSGQDTARVALDAVISAMAKSQRFGVVDVPWIERVVALIDELKNLSFVLSKGSTGGGRSRFGAVVAARNALAWTQSHPFNAFTSSVIVCRSVSSMDFARGVLQGHIRQALDHVKLIRRADLEIRNQYDPALHDAAIAELSWSDLDTAEKSIIPPVVLITDGPMLSTEAGPGLLRLMTSDLPVKILVMDDGGRGIVGLQEQLTTLVTAISMRTCFVLQSSLADPRHLFRGLLDGLHQPGPAFLRVLTPEDASGRPAWTALYDLAVASRAFPLVRFKPSADKRYLSTTMDLTVNPGIESDWCTIEVAGDGASPVRYTVTYGDWAIRQPGLRHHFALLTDESKSTLPLAEYLSLDRAARQDKTPVVIVAGIQGQPERYAVDDHIVHAAETVRIGWNTLKEIAGLLTPYPMKLRESIEQELGRKHEEAIRRIQTEYEDKFREQEKAQLAAVRQKLVDKLTALSGYTRST